MTGQPVVMLTALNSEYQAVSSRLDNLRTVQHERGTRFEVGTVRGTSFEVALGLTGKGNHSAGVLAERAIALFCPAALMFVGVAGALWGTPLGDVVCATHVYAYQGGTSEDDGLKARPRMWETAHEVSQIAQHVARAGEWKQGMPADTSVHFGLIAAGEIVKNSTISAEARWIRDHFNDALAIEMEAAGVAQAGHLNGAPVAIVRGISDQADGTKNSAEDQDWQPRAAAHAAAFATHLAVELLKEGGQTVMRNRGSSDGNIVHNRGAGTIGMQAGTISGSTVVQNFSSGSGESPDFAAELSGLRRDLEREHSLGRIDDDTYEAACSELDVADKAFASDTPEGRKTFVLALKRFGGLIADLAGLAAKLTAVVAAAKGLL
ncbi:5'-methylthioadenosine/S-adenosylhomocysteine nucleosidase family protein [Amycolatopsis dendrobii]|uniref:5'-methylthioadenosine/S-adenosylhomocysteine nucleosidase n=1 Tax=Amycolatopsis dendrobii TaxID=2760662 RepID=A0A7W3W3C2_9PSEU|nr:5'-methylthioadenosine/S-adenosylhomocysteine nucleosidase [Amycolatopsis dendrobii]MBB1158131.1 5'-methylthioadenosine/S-adenosylhomocysteine nucleosidase [Amycolatopsis dendrobii]